MASNSASQTLAKRAADAALMPPPPLPKRIKRPAKVIDEDTYTDALSHIIARDFFPGLVEIESKQEYLDALNSQDQQWIAAATRKLTEVMTPGPDGRRNRGRRGTNMTPMSGLYGRGEDTPKAWQGDTPMSVTSSSASVETSTTEKPDVDVNLSLSAFQAKYTSEDNESFYRLLDKQNQKKAEKYSWMWAGNKIAAPRQIAHRKREANLLAAKAAQETIDDGKQLLSIEPPDARKAMPDAWPVHPDNSLMFAPPSLSDSTPTIQQTAESTSRAPPKAVIYDNTRFALQSSSSSTSEPPPSPSLSAIQDALAGRPRPSASEASFSNSPSTPRVNGYSFVDSTPSPSPSELGSSSSSSGWDTSSSMSLLGTGDSTPNPFNIKDKSRREALHHRMVDKVARAKRVGKREAELRTPVPRFASSPRVAQGGLTPAAQKLLGKVGGGATAAGGWGSGGIKRRLETAGADGMKKSKLRLG